MAYVCGAAVIGAALSVPALAAPGDITVAAFLARADALRARGPFALLSADYRALRQEGEAAGATYRTRLQRERASGQPSSCPPQGARPSNEQFIAHLRSYPAAVRPQTNLRTAIADYFIRTWPCR